MHKNMQRVWSFVLILVMLLTLAPLPAAAAEESVTVYFYNSAGWSTVNAYTWKYGGQTYHGSWPGTAIEEVEGKEDWYSVTIEPNGEETVYVIFNNGSGSQTADLTIDTAYPEHWYANGSLTTTEPDEWTGITTYHVTIHYRNADSWNQVAAYIWDADGTTLNGSWPGSVVEENPDNAGWFDYELTTADSRGFSFIFNNNNGGSQTDDLSTGELTGDLELWVTGNDVTSAAPDGWVVPGCTSVIHFLKPTTWGTNTNAYIWVGGGAALPGYEAHNSWPGSGISENPEHAGWYDLTIKTDVPTAFNFIFNDGANQTADLSSATAQGTAELWVVGNEVLTEAPGQWTGNITYHITLHYQNTAGWSQVAAYIWDADGNWLNGAWPGSLVSENANNPGWYDYQMSTEDARGISFIFNDTGSNQTGDMTTGTLSGDVELWITGDTVSATAPGGWFDPSRVITIPGTFLGQSWNVNDNQMTYDEELGLYVFTFENVPAGNYEYKIAINKSWTENYGLGGVKDGPNISVSVPETMDVTVYYNDMTHISVTSLTYIFADITLTGTGIPEGTSLSDNGLTGIYSVTVPMDAGTYEDLALVYQGVSYPFSVFTLESGKDVTFYMDPATGIYYHNASDIPVDTGSIYYDSRSEACKQPYGAAATGEEITFTIQTGIDASSVALVIKGAATVPMERSGEAVDGVQLWTGTAVVNAIGEYDYYFMISNGSAMVAYGDDDGFYGVGKTCDLSGVQPYDLVVYQAGFETPDWMKNAVIYQIFPDRFYDGDSSNNQAQSSARGEVDYEFVEDWYALPENPEQEASLDKDTYLSTGAYYGDGEWSNEIYGGDLKGITEQIDYLKALGVNVIYLNPIFASISSHRYDACDYTQIDPILGTLGDFTELVEVAEANDMYIILDGVFNHVSDDSIYFDRYYKYLGSSGKVGAYPYWAYVYDCMNEDGMTQAAAEAAAREFFTAEYGITDYSYTEWFVVYNTPMGSVDNIGLRAGKDVYSYDGWWGYDSMPIIYSTEGSEYKTGNWAQEIIYNENETSVTQYWLNQGNNGWRLDVANEVSDETWQKFRESVKALDSDAVIIGEIWDDATKYLLGDMYDSVMNYQFRNAVTAFAMGGSAVTASNQLERIRERYPEEAFYAMMNLVGSHDTTRILSYLDGIGDDRADKSLEAAFPTYENTSDAAKQMQYTVSFLQFTYPGAPTVYYGDEIGMVGSDDPDDRRAFTWGKGDRQLVEWYATLAAIRSEYSALRTGEIRMLDTGSASLMGYLRWDDSATLLVLANNVVTENGSAVTFTAPDSCTGVWVDLLTGTRYDLSASPEIEVAACRNLILVAEEQAVSVQVDTGALAPAYDPAYIVGAEPEFAFDDINGTEWFADAVYEAVDMGLINGVTETTFCPNMSLSRGMVVTILWRYAGKPTVGSHSFEDVPETAYYSDAVAWACSNNITNGISESLFDPNGTVTRCQLATFLYRYCKYMGIELESGDLSSFPDAAEVPGWAKEAMSWAVEIGVIKGSNVGDVVYLAPNRRTTRAETVVMLMRLDEYLNQQ